MLFSAIHFRLPTVGLHVPAPRLLPLTIVAMATLLGVKSVGLVRAAAPDGAAAAVAPPEAAASPTTNGHAKAPAPAGKPMPAEAAATAKPSGKPADSKPGDAKAADAKAEAVPTGAAPAAPPVAAAEPAELPVSESERALLLDLRKRRDELNARETALGAREGVQAAAEARLSARVAELGSLQKRLESLESARKDHDDANWRGLVKLYESMKPKDAAAIFNDLDLPVLLPVVDRMKEQKAALVLAAMLPERARLVTAELAQLRSRANAVPPPAAATPGPAAGAASAKAASGG